MGRGAGTPRTDRIDVAIGLDAPGRHFRQGISQLRMGYKWVTNELRNELHDELHMSYVPATDMLRTLAFILGGK